MAYQIRKDYFDSLDYDIDQAISAYRVALEAHSKTVDQPAPTTSALVENIVKEHDGQYEVLEVKQPTVQEMTVATAEVMANWQKMVEDRLTGLEERTFSLEKQVVDLTTVVGDAAAKVEAATTRIQAAVEEGKLPPAATAKPASKK